MARGLSSRTAGGNKKRRKSVKLDTKKLHEFGNILGKNGVTFKLGLFNAKAARKGWLLEEGNGTNRPARPWLTAITKDGKTRGQLVALLPELVRDAAKGKNSKKKVAAKMKKVLQMHLMNQQFDAVKMPALAPNTVEAKDWMGAANPNLIGIDTFQLATSLDVQVTGGVTERKKK